MTAEEDDEDDEAGDEGFFAKVDLGGDTLDPEPTRYAACLARALFSFRNAANRGAAPVASTRALVEEADW